MKILVQIPVWALIALIIELIIMLGCIIMVAFLYYKNKMARKLFHRISDKLKCDRFYSMKIDDFMTLLVFDTVALIWLYFLI